MLSFRDKVSKVFNVVWQSLEATCLSFPNCTDNFLNVLRTHRETSRDALLEFIVSMENLSVCLHL